MKPIIYSDILQQQDVSRKLAMTAWRAQYARIQVLDVLHDKQTGHWGGASSAAELMHYLYYFRMHVDASNPLMEDRDRFILSKGHASAMLYAVLAGRGFFPEEELMSFREINSRLQGHPCMNKTPGVDMSTGALGHGISVGLGMALASMHSRRDFWTYVIVGEGCLNEGQSWEAIMAAAKFSARRLVLLVDYNKVQLDGNTQEIMPLDPLKEKFESFNWKVYPKPCDGHDMQSIHDSFCWLDEVSCRGEQAGPYVIICNTHKGNGVSFMKDKHQWHGAPVGDEDYVKARAELLEGLGQLEERV